MGQVQHIYATYDGKWSGEELAHLLRRCLFGVTVKDIDHYKGKNLHTVVDDLLHPQQVQRSLPVNDYDDLGISGVRYGSTWVNAPHVSDEDEIGRVLSFRKWSIGEMINQDRSLAQKMSLCWHNHFATQTNTGRSSTIFTHHQLLRKHCLGNLRELVRAVTLDCHMLLYLNGNENTNRAPNENYARELQELFCIGKGHRENYTEQDVKEIARVLTGWKVDLNKNQSYFLEEEHDKGDKKLSSFYNHAIIKGQTGPDAGEKELDALLSIIFRNRETALHFVRKIYRWFVQADINAEIEKKVIEPLAQTMRENDYAIVPVLKQLFTSEHFFDSNIRGSHIKSPLQFCVGLIREFEIPVDPGKNVAVHYSMLSLLADEAGKMGQLYADPPNVAGWPAYYQAPAYYKSWINSSTYPRRVQFSKTLVDFGYNREGTLFETDVLMMTSSFPDPADPSKLVDDVLKLLLCIKITDEAKRKLKENTLLSGLHSDHYWSEAWNAYVQDKTNEVNAGIVTTRLKNLYRTIISSPEYQLM